MFFEPEPQAGRRHLHRLQHNGNPPVAWGEGRIQPRNSCFRKSCLWEPG
jgi:hypothetical protein